MNSERVALLILKQGDEIRLGEAGPSFRFELGERDGTQRVHPLRFSAALFSFLANCYIQLATKLICGKPSEPRTAAAGGAKDESAAGKDEQRGCGGDERDKAFTRLRSFKHSAETTKHHDPGFRQ